MIFIAAAMTVLLAAPRHAGAKTAADINSKIEAISEREHQLDLRIRKANPGHMWMTVGGLRFDTSGRSGTGSRWQNGYNGAGTAPFTIRHYPGL